MFFVLLFLFSQRGQINNKLLTFLQYLHQINITTIQHIPTYVCFHTDTHKRKRIRSNYIIRYISRGSLFQFFGICICAGWCTICALLTDNALNIKCPHAPHASISFCRFLAVWHIYIQQAQYSTLAKIDILNILAHRRTASQTIESRIRARQWILYAFWLYISTSRAYLFMMLA